MAATDALILDFDGSVLALPGSKRVPLAQWQESVRFGCSLEALDRLDNAIATDACFSSPTGGGRHPTVFSGSGDYHHISHLLIRRYSSLGQNLQVVVFDNHPDNMRYPWGIHCGSWVWHVSRLPFVACVHVLGITSSDVRFAHAWENHLGALRAGKVRYWCVGPDLAWTKWLGIEGSRSFSSASSLLDAFTGHIQSTTGPFYVSIDKDVLAPGEVRTNWDQGVMRLDDLAAALRLLRGRIVASDVCGEVSAYRYRSRFKRLLSGLDGQPAISATDIAGWQTQHQTVNRELLRWFQEAAADPGPPAT